MVHDPEIAVLTQQIRAVVGRAHNLVDELNEAVSDLRIFAGDHLPLDPRPDTTRERP
jgi:hypothetical protein